MTMNEDDDDDDNSSPSQHFVPI